MHQKKQNHMTTQKNQHQNSPNSSN